MHNKGATELLLGGSLLFVVNYKQDTLTEKKRVKGREERVRLLYFCSSIHTQTQGRPLSRFLYFLAILMVIIYLCKKKKKKRGTTLKQLSQERRMDSLKSAIRSH